MKYQPIIGLEIHIELKTDSKMFCSCKNDPDEKRPNFNICPICLGHPGTLPVINKEAVRKVIKTGLSLNCKIPKKSKFDRKNYFYPDLPKGYQISQYDMPFCKEGYLELAEVRPPLISGGRTSQKFKKIRIARVHLEEDTGRLVHEDKNSLVDFNRAGIPLMELVTEPDITSAKEARKFAEEFQLILRYLDVSNADMEKGQMRVEVNISLLPVKSQIPNKLGTKVEIKNLNSFRNVEKAIEYEIKRQTGVLNKRKKIIQETRGWDDVKGVTVSQRKKEEAHDYRYFPEPDLPTLHLDEDFVNSARMGIPETPSQKRKRFVREYGLELKDIEIFVNNKYLGDYFEKTMSELANWIKEGDLKKAPSKQEFLKLTNLAVNYIVTDFWSLFDKVSIEELEQKIKPEN
ncbi:MAG: Asp-tRNA(Asn)/Glu-tRNA(Gln) amidotransferase subunit GatB, partial [Candidatus Nealsonbacteria bacterium]|nr:Asp-tRNA(Asn)/Glu-tRNA(Gln) amidotransferase subunit GatB [Candidatus Nealsonbacteria bacterium]